MTGKPKSWAALMKSVELALLSAMPSRKRPGKLVDKLILNCLATAANENGAGSRPGNDALMAAAGVKWAQIHTHLDGLIKAGFVHRTDEAHGRGMSSVYRINWKHTVFPDHSPNKNEWFTIGGPNLPDGSQKTSGLGPDISDTRKHPVSAANAGKTSGLEEKTSGFQRKTSGVTPEHILRSSEEQPNLPSLPSGFAPENGAPPMADGWRAFVENLPAIMRKAPMARKEKEILQKLVSENGAELMAATVARWADGRDKGVDSLRNKWQFFLAEYSAYLAEAFADTPEGRAKAQADEDAMIEAAAAFGRRCAREADEEAERINGPQQTSEETAAMLRELSK